MNRLITTFDEVPPISTYASQRKYHGVTFKTSTVEVFSSDPGSSKARAFTQPETRKDLAVHVSLSSSSLVKQPGTEAPLSLNESSLNLLRRQCATGFYRLCTTHHKVRSNTGANACPGQFRSSAALSGGAYMGVQFGCQRSMSTNRRIESFFCGAPWPPLYTVVFWRRRAALEPQSCDDLLIGNHCESPDTCGDHTGCSFPDGNGDPIA